VWSVDSTRSRVEFAVKHMMLATLKGGFGKFEGTLEVSPDGVASAVGSVDVASVDTNDAVRDEHLRSSADFFDVKRYPRIGFSSTRIEERGGGLFRVVGELTMRGVTREIVLDGQVHGGGAGADGEPRLALTLRGKLNRREFGLTWNQALDSGGALIGNTVKVALEISTVEIGVASARALA
jgi:polyisoprenoid-binding protein YceI